MTAQFWRGIACSPITLAAKYGFVATPEGMTFYPIGSYSDAQIEWLQSQAEKRGAPGMSGEDRVSSLFYGMTTIAMDSGPAASEQEAVNFVQRRIAENPDYAQEADSE